MKTRRRRWFRDETIAPWLTILVILGIWWVGARLVVPRGDDAAPRPRPLGDATVAIPSSPSAGAADGRRAEGAAAPPPSEVAAAQDRDDKRETSDEVARITDEARDDDRGDDDRAMVPVAGIEAESLTSTFNEARGGGSRRHEAMDILAPRGTPVVAAVEGRVVKLFTSAAGGLTIYQFDDDERYCYYYAHLDSYAADLTEGQNVAKGQVIGYVGTTGNAAPDTPHLHFAIFRLGADKRWWEGEPLDPITFLR